MREDDGATGRRRLRVLVCGTGFGRIHLRAVHASADLDLAGVLSRGSDASRKVAARYGVPCYTSVEELPGDIDIACVAVPSGTGAGDGAQLAQRLLERGIHVLHEHPLHPEELADCLRTAREHGVRYRVNTLYPHVEPIRRFTSAAEILRRRQPPLFIDAACGVQVLYSLLDVVARTVGGVRPWRFGEPASLPPDLAALAAAPAPYTSLHGVIGGVPLTLRVQNQLNPSDPDNHALLLHRISIGFEAGVLALVDTHGPVLWSPRLHSTRDGDGRLVLDGPGTERLDVAATEHVGTHAAPTFREVFDRIWPDAVAAALVELHRDIDERRADVAGPADAAPARAPGPGPASSAAAQASQWALSIATLWQELSDRLGPVTLIDPPEPEPVPLLELLR
ncbi:Gfo/Idh/MocA family oxidoreductase [Phytoactinopolyspora halotolerans]|uniref:Gfo/Idh/MocA family oxidoreductase n=2 Tax=Phytoactinopolyspora halotolerans TaxID=1981512 RepID=A0A6L9SBI6_9ACTN|nr:Gfo/Idh/MocA family oxidoreductase [Phytoactinopolyspora halotolerans]